MDLLVRTDAGLNFIPADELNFEEAHWYIARYSKDHQLYLLMGQDDRVGDWLAQRLEWQNLDDSVCIGVINNDGEIVAGIAFHPSILGMGIEISLAADQPKAGPGWLCEEHLRIFFDYAFNQNKNINRVWCRTKGDNKKSIRLCERIGWKKEGVLRKAALDGSDVILWSILKEECPWI